MRVQARLLSEHLPLGPFRGRRGVAAESHQQPQGSGRHSVSTRRRRARMGRVTRRVSQLEARRPPGSGRPSMQLRRYESVIQERSAAGWRRRAARSSVRSAPCGLRPQWRGKESDAADGTPVEAPTPPTAGHYPERDGSHASVAPGQHRRLSGPRSGGLPTPHVSVQLRRVPPSRQRSRSRSTRRPRHRRRLEDAACEWLFYGFVLVTAPIFVALWLLKEARRRPAHAARRAAD